MSDLYEIAISGAAERLNTGSVEWNTGLSTVRRHWNGEGVCKPIALCVFQVSFHGTEDEIGNYRLCCEYELFKNWFLISGPVSEEVLSLHQRAGSLCTLTFQVMMSSVRAPLFLGITLHFLLRSTLCIILLMRCIQRLIARLSVRAEIVFLCWKKTSISGDTVSTLHTSDPEGSACLSHTVLLSWTAAQELLPPADCFFLVPVTDCFVPVSKCYDSIVGEYKTYTNQGCSLGTKSEP